MDGPFLASDESQGAFLASVDPQQSEATQASAPVLAAFSATTRSLPLTCHRPIRLRMCSLPSLSPPHFPVLPHLLCFPLALLCAPPRLAPCASSPCSVRLLALRRAPSCLAPCAPRAGHCRRSSSRRPWLPSPPTSLRSPFSMSWPIMPFSSTAPHTSPYRPVLPRAHPSLPCRFPPHSYLPYNWLYGSVPTALFNLQLLSVIDLSYNYLTGSFPASTTLSSLDIRSNFFYAVGTMTLQSCAAISNCLASPAACSSAGTTQRPTADCAICGSTNGQPPFCGGTGTCAPDSGPAAAQGTPNVAGSALLPMVCSGVAIDAADAAVLLALKSSLGVTLNNWNTAAPCTLEGQALLPAQWGGVRCTAAGKVTSIALKRQQLKGSIHPDISKLTTLTYLDFGYNLFQGRLDFFAVPLKPLTSLKALFFHYNYFAGSIPSAIATLPQLTSLGLYSNYLTGTVPIPSKALLALDVGFNFLSGVFPNVAFMFCAGENNCFVNSTNCRTYGSVQRPAGACAICGTAGGQGDLCFGGTCAPVASAAIAAGTINSPSQPILPMSCAGQCVCGAHGWACALLQYMAVCSLSFDILPFRIAPPPAPTTLTLLMPPAMLTLSHSLLLPNSPLADNPAAPMDTGSGALTSLAAMHACTYEPPCSATLHPSLLCTYTLFPLSIALTPTAMPLTSRPPLPLNPSLTAVALLNVKSALGVTFSTWAAASPCTIANSTVTVAGTWTGVLCSASGDVLSVDLSKNVLRANLASFVSSFSGLQALQQLSVPPPSPTPPHTSAGFVMCPHSCCSHSCSALTRADPACVSLSAHSLALHATLLLQYVQYSTSSLAPASPSSSPHRRLNNNWFSGSLPQALMSLPALTLLDVHANALTGSLPAVSSTLAALFLHDNFLAGSFAAGALTACDASLNCLTSAAACGASSTTQRAAAACAICNSADAQGLLCWGGMCLPNVTATTAHPDGLAPPPMYCAGSPVVNISSVDAVALAALKSAMGVTFTTWAPATYCTVEPTPQIVGTWDGVLCNSLGKVVSLAIALCSLFLFSACCMSMVCLLPCLGLIAPMRPLSYLSNPLCAAHLPSASTRLLPNKKLTGTVPLAVSTLTALTAIDLTSNLLQGRLDEVATQLRLLTNLKSIDLAYNWLSGSVPAFMLTLPSLTKITLGYNYLTGALPNVTSPLSVVDVQFNFLAGSFPTLTLTLCAARMNCFLDATKCKNPNRAAELPRATTACAICNTTNAQGRLCSGGLCTVNATDLVALGAPNSAASPTLPLICVGAAFVAMDSVHAAAMLNLKASLGVTFTEWKADSPCSLRDAVAPGSWSGVACDATGKVLSIDLQSNLLQGRLDSFTASIKTPLVLKELALQFNYLVGPFPSTLLALSTLSKLSVGYNYLTGPFPTVPASAKSLDVQGNFLSGSFPTNALTYCAATTNCLTDANNCASIGITQRNPSECAICGTSFGQGTLCGGVTCLVNTTGVTAPPTATSLPRNLYCTPVALDTNTSECCLLLLACPSPAPFPNLIFALHPSSRPEPTTTPFPLLPRAATTLLALKTVLGVTATDWSATTVALKPKALKSSSVPLATMVGACTIEGQTPAPGSWTGVFCNSAGAIVALVMPNQKLTGSLSADISKLTALTALDLSANLFQRGLDAFVAPLTAVKTLKSLPLQHVSASRHLLSACPLLVDPFFAHIFSSPTFPLPAPITHQSSLLKYCHFSSPHPPCTPSPLPMAARSKLNRNYLTGVVPAVGAAVKALNVAGNFLSGSFPTTGLTACDARSNCFADASKCTNTLGTAQRAATECNICGTTGAVGPFCGGGFCIPNAAAPAAAATPNMEGQAVLAMSCMGGPIEVTMRGAMLNLKASLGVTLTDWVGTAPCNIAGQAPVAGSWSGVECDSAAKVTSILVATHTLFFTTAPFFLSSPPRPPACVQRAGQQPAAGPPALLHHQLQKPRGTQALVSRFCSLPARCPCHDPCRMLACDGGAFYPCALCCSRFDMSYNYLTGPLPSAIGTALKTLEIGGNFLSGAIGNFPGVACSAALNCLTSQGSCTTGGVQNRAGCNICGSADAQGTLCGGGLCVPNATAAVVAGQTPTLSTPVMPMYCTGVIMNTVAVAALLNIKTALGVTLSDWTAPTTLLKPKAAAGSGSVALTDWLTTGGYCTVEGQTAAPGAFSGVRCNALGQPVSLNLPFQKLTGSLHADLSKLSALTVLELSYNFLRAPVEPWASAIKLLTNLLSLKLSNNYLYGSVPLWLVSFAKLTNLELSMNALTGTFPAPISTALKRLMVDQNFLGGTFPANSATYCTAYYNCIPTYTTCNSLNPNAPNPSASCQICGMTDGLGTACMGNPCVPATPSPITAINKWSPAPAMRCDPVPIQATQASALVAMTPGQWGAQTTCTLAGQPTAAGTSPSVYCNPAGLVLEMYTRLLAPPLSAAQPAPFRTSISCLVLTGGKASGSFPSHVSKLSALTKLDLSANLFSGRLDSFLAPFLALKTLNSLRLHQNYFSGSFPTGISALTALTELRLNLNYLTGSMPAALPGTLKVIDLSSNYLVGTFPTTTATSVSCASNCLQDASKCPAGSAQRAAGACAICETPDATGSMCNGGICTPTAATTVNNGTAALFCVGSSMDPAMGQCAGGEDCAVRGAGSASAALPNVRASLGVTFTDCCLSVPPLPFLPSPPPLAPLLATRSGGAAEREGVDGAGVHQLGAGRALHHAGGAAAARRLAMQQAPKLQQPWLFPLPHLLLLSPLSSLSPSHAYLLCLLRSTCCPPTPPAVLPTSHFSINVRTNYLEGRLDVFTTNFKALTALKEVYFDYNYFSGPIPSALVAMASLSTFGARWNYLYGAVPPLAPALKTLAVDGNWLSGTFPGAGFSSCSATKNCFASIGACTTGGTVQRNATTECAVCDSPDGTGTICGGGTCVPNTINIYPNGPNYAPRPRFCVGVALDATQGNILLALKTTLGATFSDWTAATLAAPKATSPKTKTGKKPKSGGKRRVLQGRGSMMQYDWKLVGSCTIQGQTPIAGAWTGVRCSPLGQVVALELQGQQLGGTVHSDISKLTTLTSLRLSSNLFFNRLDSYIVPITAAASLKELPRRTPSFTQLLFSNYFTAPPLTFPPRPSYRFELHPFVPNAQPLFPVLCVQLASALSRNYLTGTLPKPAATLKALDTEFNFLSGTFPAASLGYCTVRGNCFLNASACVNFDGTLQRGAGCNVCGSSNGQLPMCGGAVCTPDPSAYVAGKVANSASAPTLALKCPPLALDATSSAVLLNIGAALGVTHTDWTASSTCNIIGQTIAPKSFPGVWCSGSGAVVSLWPHCPKASSLLSCLSSAVPLTPPLHLGYNLLYGRLATFVSSITLLTTIVVLNLSFNYLYDSIPFALLNMPSLTEMAVTAIGSAAGEAWGSAVSEVWGSAVSEAWGSAVSEVWDSSLSSALVVVPSIRISIQDLYSHTMHRPCCPCRGLSGNYFTGVLPSVSTKVQAITVANNFLAGPITPQAYKYSDFRNNCLSLFGIPQRTTGCAICGTTNAVPPLCNGAPCVLNATDALAAGTVNNLTAPLLPFYCGRPAIDATAGAPMPAACMLHIANTAGAEGGAGSVAEHVAAGLAVRRGGQHPHAGQLGGRWLDLVNMGLRGSLPADLTKLTALTKINLASNLLEGRLAEWGTMLTTVKSLKHLALNYNWFSGTLPAYLLSLSTLTTLNVHYNYLTGYLAPIAATLKTINVASNFLAGPFPASSTTMCDARNNCLSSAANCVSSGSSVQRASCTICNGDAAYVLCGGGVCSPNTDGPLASKTPNSATAGVLPMRCTGVRIDPAAREFRASSMCLLHVPAPCACSMCLLHVTAPCDCSMCLLHVTAPCACSMCLLHVPAPCACSMCLLHVTAPCDCSMCLLHVSAPCVCSSAARILTPRPTCHALGGLWCSTLPSFRLYHRCVSPLLAPLLAPLLFPLLAALPVVPILATLKTALGVPHPGWGEQTMCTVSGIPKGPEDMPAVYCNWQGKVIDLFLKWRLMRGVMPPDISKFTGLTALDLSGNFLSGRLDPFITPLTGLTGMKILIMNYNFFSGSIPASISAIKNLMLLSLGWNYLTGTVPDMPPKLRTLDLEYNWLTYTFPTAATTTATWDFCTVRQNCFIDPTPCGNGNIIQRYSCAVCGTTNANGTLCGGTTTCQPDPAAVRAATNRQTSGSPQLAITCPPPQPVATNATAVGALMNIKMALGLTYTDWATTSTCTAAGTALGGFTGVECNSAGQPVKISLKSNLFRARLDEFASKIPSLPNLAVLLLDFNWFYGSLPPGLVAMPKLTRLGMSYNYLTYRVPPLAAGLKDIDVGFNFLSGSFPTNSATSCGANNNCFLAVTGCTTKGTVQRTTGCSFCLSDTAQGMLCYGRGICTVNASAPFAAGTPNAVGATTLPMACVDVLCATASPVMCPTDWRCSGLQCVGNNFANCFGFLCTG
ncbi:unnamed protein product [Closterium sp. NIES-65]|nr:unnamed protein product [Closterium sp. NIES-65]